MSTKQIEATAIGRWSVLRAGGHDGGGLEIPTIPTNVSTAGGPVRLAIGPHDEPRVLLPLTEREKPGVIDGGPALSISLSSFAHEGRAIRFLDLICLSRDLETVFGEVVDEMLARISRGDRCIDAAVSTIEDFRSLLMRTKVADVDKARAAGLVAELLVLNRLLDRSSSAWKVWRGPAGDRHDFRHGDTSLEVKASLHAGASAMTINGLDQLEAPAGGTLHLLRVVLEPVSGGMLSISSLGRSALSKADEPERVRELLDGLGCNDVDAAEWNRHPFRMESEALYEVRPGFPRLTSSMLKDGTAPPGVQDVSYRIDLSLAAAFLCDTSAYRNLEISLSP